MKSFSEFQAGAGETATYPDAGRNMQYPAIGLAGETGEVCEIVKKAVRDSGGVLLPYARERLAGELGDVLWYVARLATEAGLDLGDIAERNYKKLIDRKARGVLGGSGSTR